jgi:serine O-acetyltransferase
MKYKKRHPTVEDNVTIYANATILGGETIIGKNSTIGGNVWITESIPENSLVYHTSESKLKPKN